jgi:PhzF family phenazine biosynthesis protein
MRIPLYQVDAFASRVFAGNPAAVCPLEAWIEPSLMQSIALENNLSETAFIVKRDDGGYDIRWFTPAAEIDLAGHPTLATAYVIFEVLERGRDAVRFHTLKSGTLDVRRDGARLSMDFPATDPAPVPIPPGAAEALGVAPETAHLSRDLLLVFASEDDVRSIRPRMDGLAEIAAFGVIASAPGRDVDFVSRFFAPNMGVPEDPVTGSAHCTLTPYWAKRLGKARLHGRQISARGGDLWCADRGPRVSIAGRAVLYMEGAIHV